MLFLLDAQASIRLRRKYRRALARVSTKDLVRSGIVKVNGAVILMRTTGVPFCKRDRA
jgi:hypothetical protein